MRFTVIPEQGTQVWAVLSRETIFDDYTIQSANSDIINLEVPVLQLQRALKSALQATSANLRLTKKDNLPVLCLTINTHGFRAGHDSFSRSSVRRDEDPFDEAASSVDFSNGSRERETIVTQDIPVRVLGQANVDGIHEPRCRDPDVHIQLPSLLQLKNVSDRFTKLALVSKTGPSSGSNSSPRLEMSANMHGCLKLSIRTDAMNVSTLWTGLHNPDLDPSQVEGGEEGIANHASTKMKQLGSSDGKSEEGWATVRIDGRDWGKVMSVGRLSGRVIACFCHDHALILYVFLTSDEESTDTSVLTVGWAQMTRRPYANKDQYYISSYSA